MRRRQGSGPRPVAARAQPHREYADQGLRQVTRFPGVSWRPVEVNGGPGALFLHGQERLIGVMALDIGGGQITSISSIVNPDKLAHLGPVADVESLLRSAK